MNFQKDACNICHIPYKMANNDNVIRPALVAEWAMPLAAVHAGQGSLPVRVEA